MNLIYIHSNIYLIGEISLIYFLFDYIFYKTNLKKYNIIRLLINIGVIVMIVLNQIYINQIYVTMPKKLLYYINNYSNILFYDYYNLLNEIYKFCFYIFYIDIWFFTAQLFIS